MAVTEVSVRPPEVVSLPTTADPAKWSDDEKALLDAAGLVIHKKGKPPEPAPRSTVVAFLNHCARTGLDPIARQIYAIKRGDKWGIQVSIDGLRLVAERSRQYAGQIPVQWTADGKTWVDVWIDADTPPLAARVGVIRRDFDQPLIVVARFEAYAVYEDEWIGEYPDRKKSGKRTLSEMWKRMHAEQLAKVGEALALRKAFPMELSGLYTAEEMDQATPQADGDPVKRAGRKAPELDPGTRSAQRDPLPDAEVASGGEESADEAVDPASGEVADTSAVDDAPEPDSDAAIAAAAKAKAAEAFADAAVTQ
jgi:phage recombination protein Bet